MSEDTEEGEVAARGGEGETGPDAEDVERAAESFLDLESEIPVGSAPGGVWGTAVDVERVPASDVPESYPVEVTTAEALALTLDAGEERAVAYFEWGEAADGRLERLLAVKGIPPGRFADLHGERLLLDVEGGHYVPYVPDERPRGSALGVYGVAAGLGLNLLTAALAAAGLGAPLASAPSVALWLLVNLIALPAATYVDAWHLRTRTDWEGGPLFWAALAALPGVNVLSSAAYLFGRYRTTPLD